jgi:hypothetical protein
MATHTQLTISGGTVTGGTGGISSGDIVGTVTRDNVRDVDGSNQIGIDCDTSTFTNAPGSATSVNDVSIFWTRAGTSTVNIKLTDNSSSSGEFETDNANYINDSAVSTSFADFTGVTDGPRYTNGTYEWNENVITDGEGFQETYITIIWNGATVFGPSGAGFGTIPSGTTSVTVGDYIYTRGTDQTGSGSLRDFQVSRRKGPVITYINGTGVTITHLRMVVDVATASASGGSIVPLRTLEGSPLSTGSNDSGWIAVNLGDELELSIYQGDTAGSGEAHTYAFDATIEFWARASGYNDTKLKEIRTTINTFAESSF